MTRLSASKQSLDELSQVLCGLVWLAGALLSWAIRIDLWFAAVCLIAGILNLVGALLCLSRVGYVRIGRLYAAVMRSMQGILVACACVFPEVREAHLWLLGAPILLADTLVQRSVRRGMIISLLIGLTAMFETYRQGGGTVEAWTPLVVYFATAALAVVLMRYREREELLTCRFRRMNTLLGTAKAMASQDLSKTLGDALSSVMDDLGATAGLVALTIEEESSTLRSATSSFGGPVVIPQDSLSASSVLKRGPVIETRCANCPNPCPEIPVDSGIAVSVPLLGRVSDHSYADTYHEEAMGALTLAFADQGDSIDEEDLDLLQAVCALLGSAVAHQRLQIRRRSTFLQSLESLAIALEARDDYTRGHSSRVCEVSIKIGQAMNFSPDALEELRIGTTLHDIGKIGVPDAILNKKGGLSSEEYEVMKQHPVIGYDICKPLRLSEPILRIIRNHHERLDGHGYPDRLSSDEMPANLRIVCVADAFDAMSSTRSYRPLLDHQTVVQELDRNSGIQFDPEVVEVVKDLLQSGELDDLYRHFWSTTQLRAA